MLGILLLLSCLIPLMLCGPANLRFTDIAQDGESGLSYTYKNGDYVPGQTQEGVTTEPGLFSTQFGGMNGLLVWDYDNDGDLDIYATSSKNVPNHLFKNLLVEEGQLQFENVYSAAGVGMETEDSRGTCCADIDNDGALDFYVCTGKGSSNHFFRNNGDVTFEDITDQVNLPGLKGRYTIGCSFGDVNHDGYHDLYVGVVTQFQACDLNAPNILYISTNSELFEDESTIRGVDTWGGATWALSLVDYDQDGDLDLITGDDGCAGYGYANAGVGYVRIWENDGEGYFTEVTFEKSIYVSGGYMGLTFADFDQDGTIDVFATDIGHWTKSFRRNFTAETDGRNSRWFLNDETGTLVDPGMPPEILYTPFGWGACAFDLDNSGTSDIVFHGGFLSDGIYFLADSPGFPLLNQGDAVFVLDPDARSETDHRPRKVNGVAIGDLNRDGFVDIVSISNYEMDSESIILLQFEEFGQGVDFPSKLPFGSAYDDIVGFVPHLFQLNGTHYLYNDQVTRTLGSISVEISSGDNENNWIAVTAIGLAGVITNARTPRDGVGAVIRVTPVGKKAQIIPVISGDSFGSTSSFTKIFGLGNEEKADVEIMWPGNVVNKIYDIFAGQGVMFHEIPCSFTDPLWDSYKNFSDCVLGALSELENWSLNATKVYGDQMRAYLEHGGEDSDECTAETHDCHTNADCTDLTPGFTCACKPGYAGDGVTSCDDIDECTAVTDNCHANADCSNDAPSFHCTCQSGYDGDGVTCTEVYESEPEAGYYNGRSFTRIYVPTYSVCYSECQIRTSCVHMSYRDISDECRLHTLTNTGTTPSRLWQRDVSSFTTGYFTGIFTRVSLSSFDKCCSECEQSPSCVQISFRAGDNQCRLFESIDGFMDTPRWKRDLEDPLCPTESRMIWDGDFILSKDLSFGECCNVCLSDVACIHFSSKANGHCRLFSTVKELKGNRFWMSDRSAPSDVLQSSTREISEPPNTTSSELGELVAGSATGDISKTADIPTGTGAGTGTGQLGTAGLEIFDENESSGGVV